MINWLVSKLLKNERFITLLILSLAKDPLFEIEIKKIQEDRNLTIDRNMHELLQRVKKLEEVTSLIRNSLLSQLNIIGN